MSLKKPIINVTKKCLNCRGCGRMYFNMTTSDKGCICSNCNGTGKVDVTQSDPNFEKFYIKNLEEVIDYWTRLYRNKRDESIEYLKKVKEYCKELDKVVNKEKK